MSEDQREALIEASIQWGGKEGDSVIYTALSKAETLMMSEETAERLAQYLCRQEEDYTGFGGPDEQRTSAALLELVSRRGGTGRAALQREGQCGALHLWGDRLLKLGEHRMLMALLDLSNGSRETCERLCDRWSTFQACARELKTHSEPSEDGQVRRVAALALAANCCELVPRARTLAALSGLRDATISWLDVCDRTNSFAAVVESGYAAMLLSLLAEDESAAAIEHACAGGVQHIRQRAATFRDLHQRLNPARM